MLAPAFFLAGRLALRKNFAPAFAAPWLSVMLVGTLYALLATMLFAVVQICVQQHKAKKKAVALAKASPYLAAGK